MRLIDADKVIEHLEKVKKESASLVDMAHILGFQSVIDAQPTAYDPDKVAEQLEDYSDADKAERFGIIPAIGLANAIKIVKGGGVDGN